MTDSTAALYHDRVYLLSARLDGHFRSAPGCGIPTSLFTAPQRAHLLPLACEVFSLAHQSKIQPQCRKRLMIRPRDSMVRAIIQSNISNPCSPPLEKNITNHARSQPHLISRRPLTRIFLTYACFTLKWATAKCFLSHQERNLRNAVVALPYSRLTLTGTLHIPPFHYAGENSSNLAKFIHNHINTRLHTSIRTMRVAIDTRSKTTLVAGGAFIRIAILTFPCPF